VYDKRLRETINRFSTQNHDISGTSERTVGTTLIRIHSGITRDLVLPLISEERKKESMEEQKITGETSDGYHTFNELYEFRKLYNAALFNEWGVKEIRNVHKSKKHHSI